MRAELIGKISLVLDDMNVSQRIIAMDMISSNEYSFLERNGKVHVKTPDGELVDFLSYVKNRCNCS